MPIPDPNKMTPVMKSNIAQKQAARRYADKKRARMKLLEGVWKVLVRMRDSIPSDECYGIRLNRQDEVELFWHPWGCEEEYTTDNLPDLILLIEAERRRQDSVRNPFIPLKKDRMNNRGDVHEEKRSNTNHR